MRDEKPMADVIGNVLRYGVILSSVIIVFGLILLINASGSADANSFLSYDARVVPTLQGFLNGLAGFQPFSVIELGAIVLIATPVVRVLMSVFLFAAEKDRLYTLITAVVLTLLVFSLFVTPFIPAFHA